MILRKLHGKPVNESTSDENMACLMRCYQHFNGYNPLIKPIREALGSCVEHKFVATAINSTMQLLARCELSRLDCVITQHAASSQQPSSQANQTIAT
jgi:hypothetical protein